MEKRESPCGLVSRFGHGFFGNVFGSVAISTVGFVSEGVGFVWIYSMGRVGTFVALTRIKQISAALVSLLTVIGPFRATLLLKRR
jgi:hypothetical protein